jgi:hypothetical protein
VRIEIELPVLLAESLNRGHVIQKSTDFRAEKSITSPVKGHFERLGPTILPFARFESRMASSDRRIEECNPHPNYDIIQK